MRNMTSPTVDIMNEPKELTLVTGPFSGEELHIYFVMERGEKKALFADHDLHTQIQAAQIHSGERFELKMNDGKIELRKVL